MLYRGSFVYPLDSPELSLMIVSFSSFPLVKLRFFSKGRLWHSDHDFYDSYSHITSKAFSFSLVKCQLTLF